MKQRKKEPKKFIFLEESGKRWKISKYTFLLSIIALAIIAGMMLRALVQAPDMAGVDVSTHNIEPILTPFAQGEDVASTNVNETEQLELTAGQKSQKTDVFAFYQQDFHGEEQHKLSLERNIDAMDTLVPDWFTLTKDFTIENKADTEIDALAREAGVKILPDVSLTYDGTEETMDELMEDPKKQAQVINELYDMVQDGGYDGIHMNLTYIEYEDAGKFEDFSEKLYTTFHDSGLTVALNTRVEDDTFDTEVLADYADHLVVQAYDENNENSKSGSPIASFEWTKELFEQYDGPEEKLVLSLANFGYNWNVSQDTSAEIMSFPEIMQQARNQNLEVQWDEKNFTPYVRYKEEDDEHLISFLDASTFYNQMMIAKSNNVHSIGVWNIGSEDSSIWSLFENGAGPESISEIPNIVPITDGGAGDVFQVTTDEQDGERSLEVTDDVITGQEYLEYSTPYHIERYGQAEKKIAISFDDGPDPKYTGQILDILSERETPATFFVLGQNASNHPEFVERIYREGHEIGNHTYSHKDIQKSSTREFDFELNSTQRIIQGITGRSTVLFRPPFLSTNDEGSNVPAKETMEKISHAQDLDYMLMGSLIDPRDWEGDKTSDQIVQEVTKRAEDGNIILLHDAGGDRTETIEALPRIIEWLEEEGYEIVPSAELIGMSRDEVMPEVSETEAAISPFFSRGSITVSSITEGVTYFIYGLIAVGLLRLIVLIYFSWKQKRRKKVFNESYQPLVSVLIAAYNEETVIAKTIHSILKSRYPNLDIVVVDDGSKDGTSRVMEEEFGSYSNVRLIKKSNGGKSSALNLGFKDVYGEITVTLDADTTIDKNTITNLIRHFSDERVGAVSGNVKIGNRKNLLTWWQHIEYVTGFNLEKRAFDELECITVVPGAVGAWRNSALQEVNYFEDDTLAEDTDITLKLLRKGYLIKSEVDAVAYTEAPEDVRSFVKQRYRWTYGILQCFWKHKRAMVDGKNKKLTFIAAPNMLFQYVLIASAPLIDLILLLGLASGSLRVLYFYAGFLLVDTLVSVYAFKLENESKKPLVTVFIQRLVYRQFFTYVVWKSFVFAIRGGVMGWNKLKRTGNVNSVSTIQSKRGA